MSERFLKFKGTHKEIGQQVAELYKQWGRSGVRTIPQADDYFDTQLKIYQKYFPQYLDYLEGMAIGFNLDKDLVIKSLLTIYLERIALPKYCCSAFALNNKNGIFIGRNYDWREKSEAYSSNIRFEFTDSQTVCGNTDMGVFAGPNETYDLSRRVILLEDAWNENLYIGLNGAPENSFSVGMTTPHIVQAVAETCRTVAEAVSLIENIPSLESKIYTIADKNGDLCVVEKHAKLGTKVRTDAKFVIATNHFLHKDLYLENASMFEPLPFHSSFARYSYLDIMLNKNYDNFDFSTIKQIMLKPPVLQNWRGEEMGDVITDWSLSLELTSGRFVTTFAPLTTVEELTSSI